MLFDKRIDTYIGTVEKNNLIFKHEGVVSDNKINLVDTFWMLKLKVSSTDFLK